MALPILDGNQTAATLSTVLTGGEHIPAHTVVSLGSQAITDVRSAVSGSVVSISNFPSTQSISGTVTVGASSVTFNSNVAKRPDGSWQPLSVESGSNYVNARVYPSDITPFLATVTVGGFAQNAVTTGYTYNGTAVSSLPVIVMENALGSIGSVDISSGSINVTNSVTIGSLPAISGTVTANVLGYDSYNGVYPSLPIGRADDSIAGADNVVKVAIATELGGVNDSRPLPISGTVTANNPNGALTTRFGSVVTANLSQITSAVTNTNRKYLLAQNISAGTVTIGIGFSPTTTQGIQLTAGGGLTFDAFCPTGAVYWLGAVTGAAFTILEG